VKLAQLAGAAVPLDDPSAAALLQQQTELLSPLCLTWAPDHSMPPADNAEKVSLKHFTYRHGVTCHELMCEAVHLGSFVAYDKACKQPDPLIIRFNVH